MTEERKLELMNLSIDIAEMSESEKGKSSPKVGAVLADAGGKVLLTCYRGETGSGNHCEYGLLKKAKDSKLDVENTTLFVTLEPCVSRGPNKTPCAQRIVEANIKEVYIGTLDPNPVIIGKGEMYLRSKGVVVERYPHDLNEKLCEINKDFFDKFKNSFLPNNSLFMSKNISQIALEYLNKKGYDIENLPNNWNNSFDYLSAYCQGLENNAKSRKDLLNKALGYAYDKKYGNRDYKDDVRGAYKQWTIEFNNILNELNVGSLNDLRTLVVGIGNGHEGRYLYSDIKDLTIVDIAPESLNSAKKLLKPKKAYVLNAQDLCKISSESVEAYISLLTYQSTYFDIGKALVEAYRVLENNGIIIISIACGFMKEKGIYIDGLINPQTGAVDRNRPYDLVNVIRRKLISYKFISLGIRTTPSEIYIYARKSR